MTSDDYPDEPASSRASGADVRTFASAVTRRRALQGFAAGSGAALAQVAVGKAEAAAPDERYARGMEVLRKIGGEGYDIPIRKLAETSPDLARFTVEFPYGDVLSRPGLELKLRQFVTVSSLLAQAARSRSSTTT